MRGMALGEGVALQALGRHLPVGLAAFAPDRFGDLNTAFKVDWAGYNPFSTLEEVA